MPNRLPLTQVLLDQEIHHSLKLSAIRFHLVLLACASYSAYAC